MRDTLPTPAKPSSAWSESRVPNRSCIEPGLRLLRGSSSRRWSHSPASVARLEAQHVEQLEQKYREAHPALLIDSRGGIALTGCLSIETPVDISMARQIGPN